MKKYYVEFNNEDGTIKKFNSGKEFTIPLWTIDRHEKALDNTVSNISDDISEKEQARIFKYYVIYQVLSEIDENVTIDDIKRMNAVDLIQLFNAIYDSGKRGIIKNFQEGEKTEPPKEESTTMKN